jgi:hypothetical protein
VDAVVFLLDTPLSNEQLARLCKIAFFLGVCAFLAALLGWTCCCLKQFEFYKKETLYYIFFLKFTA